MQTSQQAWQRPETSVDAKVPVALAVAMLAVMFAFIYI